MAGRIRHIDILKGIAILIIVYGHIIPGSIPFITGYFSSFHIPLFFFVSGLLYNEEKYSRDFKGFLCSRLKSLGVPFVVFSCIVAGLYIFVAPDYPSFLRSLLSKGWGGYALWFVPVLFVSELVYWPLAHLRRRILVASLAVSAVVSYTLAAEVGFVSHNILLVFCGVFFYGCGNLCRRFVGVIGGLGYKKMLPLMFAAFLLSAAYLPFADELPEWFINKIPSPLFYLTPFFAIFAIWCLSVMLERIPYFSTFLAACGRQSFIILAFHQILCLILQQFVPSKLAILLTAMILAILVVSIPKYCPWMLGKKKAG